MAQALYRKYRSKNLDEIVGQTHVTDVLRQALKQDKVSHAYLLTGPRGVGKTSIARIMAYEINQLSYSGDGHLDIIEIDAASNNGVDDVRDLREKVAITPVSAAKKVYIIDEVHMLSKPAFNALLKTLEEPPAHVVFILATTEVHKLPDTILSRTQRFHFRPIGVADMKKHLQTIAKKEAINIDDDALELIAERADGSFRDGISLLDQIGSSSNKKITEDMVVEMLGLASKSPLKKLIKTMTTGNLAETVTCLNELQNAGVSPVVLSQQLSHALRDDLATSPEMIEVIDQLIDVGRSFNPQLKLLAVVAAATARSSTGPTHLPAHTQKVVKADARVASIAAKPPPQKPAKKPLSSLGQSEEVAVEWPKLIAYVRQHHSPLFGILKNAKPDTATNELILHFNFALHAKKLETGQYRKLLETSLIALYQSLPSITITTGKISPKNQSAHSVAAIMGGGEEVSVS